MWLCALGGLTAPLSRALPTNHVPWLQWLVELAAHWQWVYATVGAVAMGLANICVPPEQLDATVQEWAETICERSPTAIAIAKRSFNMDTAHQAGIAGMGLGAFELGFSRFQVGSADVTYTHPENLVLQWVAELGLPVALLLAALVVVIATRLLRAARHSMLDQILLVGVCGAMLHDLFDFALELNALPIAVVVVVGLVAAREDPSREPPRRNVHRALFLAPALVLTRRCYHPPQGPA